MEVLEQLENLAEVKKPSEKSWSLDDHTTLGYLLGCNLRFLKSSHSVYPCDKIVVFKSYL